MKRKRLKQLRRQVANYKRKRSDESASDLGNQFHKLKTNYRRQIDQLVNSIIQRRPFRVNKQRHYQLVELIPKVKLKQRRHRQRNHYQQVELIPKVNLKQRRRIKRQHYSPVELLQNQTRELLPVKHYNHIDLLEMPQKSSETYERLHYDQMSLPEVYQTRIKTLQTGDLVVTGIESYEYANVHDFDVELPIQQSQYDDRIADLYDDTIKCARNSNGEGLLKLMNRDDDGISLRMNIKQYVTYRYNAGIERYQAIYASTPVNERPSVRAFLKDVYDDVKPRLIVDDVADQYHIIYDTGEHGK